MRSAGDWKWIVLKGSQFRLNIAAVASTDSRIRRQAEHEPTDIDNLWRQASQL